ncbi:hypothetical protein RISK_000889 [Rhodopirellula islandica]|uniref:Uncharacterized protein n=1 Tax=Rhodopirellula islandica TaxID=595434 RepID=A0A0J1BKX9_RHOIS|nr:hypothetical protein RISK_000889 [Rhodopirellula islandica]
MYEAGLPLGDLPPPDLHWATTSLLQKAADSKAVAIRKETRWKFIVHLCAS